MKRIMLLFSIISCYGFAASSDIEDCNVRHEQVEYLTNKKYRTVVISRSLTPPKIRRSKITVQSSGLELLESDLLPDSLPITDTEMNRIGNDAYEIYWSVALKFRSKAKLEITDDRLDFDIMVTCDTPLY